MPAIWFCMRCKNEDTELPDINGRGQKVCRFCGFPELARFGKPDRGDWKKLMEKIKEAKKKWNARTVRKK